MLSSYRNFFTLVLIATLISCSSSAQQTDISVSDFEKAINTQKIQLLDVRSSAEYDNGHLPASLQADWNNDAEFAKRILSLDKNVPVYTYCLSGARSRAATAWLNANGFIAFNMEGGINKWRAAGKNIEQFTRVDQLSVADYWAKIPKDKTVLVDFGAVWCPPCKKMDIVLADLQAKYGERFTLVKIDGGINRIVVENLQIEEFPTLIIYKQGKQVWKKQGLTTVEEVLKEL